MCPKEEEGGQTKPVNETAEAGDVPEPSDLTKQLVAEFNYIKNTLSLIDDQTVLAILNEVTRRLLASYGNR